MLYLSFSSMEVKMTTERDEIVSQVRDAVMKELRDQGGSLAVTDISRSFDKMVAGSRAAWWIKLGGEYKTDATTKEA